MSSFEHIESVFLERRSASRVEHITAGKALQSPRYWRIEEYSADSSSLREIEPDGRAYTLLSRLLETLLAAEVQGFRPGSMRGVYYGVAIVHSDGCGKRLHLISPDQSPDEQIRDVGAKLEELFDLFS